MSGDRVPPLQLVVVGSCPRFRENVTSSLNKAVEKKLQLHIIACKSRVAINMKGIQKENRTVNQSLLKDKVLSIHIIVSHSKIKTSIVITQSFNWFDNNYLIHISKPPNDGELKHNAPRPC